MFQLYFEETALTFFKSIEVSSEGDFLRLEELRLIFIHHNLRGAISKSTVTNYSSQVNI